MTAVIAPELAPNIARHPRPAQWLCLQGSNKLGLRTGKVEIGQGLHAALTRIVAEELCWPLERLLVIPPSTADSPDEGVTSGSLSIQESGLALRWMAACVRERLSAIAAANWGCGVSGISTHAGVIHAADGRTLNAFDLLAQHENAVLDLPLTSPPRLLTVDERPVTGTARPAELQRIFEGAVHFLHDWLPEGLLHGRVLHPASLDDTVSEALRHEVADIGRIDGILDAWCDGALIAVVGDNGPVAERAIKRLRQTRQDDDALPESASHNSPGGTSATDVDAWPDSPSDSRVVAEHHWPPSPARPSSAAQTFITLRARYQRPWLAHASIGPSCALARWADGSDPSGTPQLQVWTHSQGIFGLRRDLALAFGLPEQALQVHHRPGAGCYGHNGADDVAFDAALLARRFPGRILRVMWSREDECTVAPLGPAALIELEATLDASGEVRAWTHTIWSPGHSTRPGRSAAPALRGHAAREGGQPLPDPIDMPLAVGGGADRNALPAYSFPAWRVIANRVRTPWRSSALRALGAFANVFAIESFVDELAQATGQCALRWRLEHLPQDPRGQTVLSRAAAAVDWQSGDPLRGLTPERRDAADRRGQALGRGLGYARYKGNGAWCAVVADVRVAESVHLERLTIAADLGRVIDPDGVHHQIEGAAIQACSWTLREGVLSSRRGTPDARSWDDLPVLRFSDIPPIEVMIEPSDAPSLGAGEAAVGPTVAALANAIAHALGVRLRSLPFTPDRVARAVIA